jgi:hypothetical protein
MVEKPSLLDEDFSKLGTTKMIGKQRAISGGRVFALQSQIARLPARRCIKA